MRRIVWLLALLPVLAAFVVAGCGGGGGETSGGTGGGETGASGEPIKIGASLPLTGDFSEPGVAAQQGYQIWADQVNKAGGLLGRPVTVTVKDDQSDQNVVVTDYNALIQQEKVDLLLGTFSSLLNLPASAVAERNRMLYVEPAGGSPEMFSRGFKYLFFAQQATAEHQADLFSQWAAGLPADQKPKTAAYVIADDPFGGPVAEGIQSQLEAAGVQTVYSKTYPPETTNFDAIANAVASKQPDVIAQGSAGLADGVGFDRALIKVGYSPKQLFQASTPSFADQFSNAVGLDNTEGIFYAVSYHVDAPTPGNTDFLAAYRAKFNTDPPEDAADAYAAAQVLQAAVTAVGSIDDQEALADWLRANSVDTILGTLSWDDTGAPEQAFLLAQWQSGDEEIVLPEDAATSDTIVNPKPPWKK
ncbi:MAG TPA: amino acid ABC transporter substrate-binding protein [Gaiellaceae bacterium]|jgi:branched-chain amino acid transport system substrate-binding protein|nr:amino acid ABC transporter substrate-binding protein [Gaiellaceae bacterium]